MNQETWDMVVQYAPWVIIVVGAICYYDLWKDARQGKAQKLSHEFSKMGSKVITAFLDAYSRGDRQEEVKQFNAIVSTYGVEGGAKKFCFDVLAFSIDDLMDDKDYDDRVFKLIGEYFIKHLTDKIDKQKLFDVSQTAGKYGFRDTSKLIGGFATTDGDAIRAAFQSLVSRMSDVSRIDDVLMEVVEVGIPELMKDASHAVKLRALVPPG